MSLRGAACLCHSQGQKPLVKTGSYQCLVGPSVCLIFTVSIYWACSGTESYMSTFSWWIVLRRREFQNLGRAVFSNIDQLFLPSFVFLLLICTVKSVFQSARHSVLWRKQKREVTPQSLTCGGCLWASEGSMWPLPSPDSFYGLIDCFSDRPCSITFSWKWVRVYRFHIFSELICVLQKGTQTIKPSWRWNFCLS